MEDVDSSNPDALPDAQGMGGGAALWHNEAENTQKIYVDRQFFASYEDQVKSLQGSKTVYIGNLSFYTTEAQIYELCSRVGPVKKVIMGLNRRTKTPCGFCFVEHYTPEAALENVCRVTGMILDDRPLRSELDFGFREGRQYGRGQSGGQVRDDRRLVYDAARAARTDDDQPTSIAAAPVDAEAAERRKRRFLDETQDRPEEEEIKVTGAKRRRGDDDDDDDKGSDDDE